MTTTVCPACNAFVTPVNGPAWYMGPHTRWVPWSTRMPKPWQNTAAAVPATSSGSPSGSGRRTPLGRPVVPDVYIITVPGLRGGCGPGGQRFRSVRGRKCSISPTAKQRSGPRPASRAAARASSARSAWPTRTFASQLATTYAASAGARCEFTGTK